MWLRSGQIRLVSWDVRNWQYLPTNETTPGHDPDDAGPLAGRGCPRVTRPLRPPAAACRRSMRTAGQAPQFPPRRVLSPAHGRNMPVTCDGTTWQYLTPMTHTID